MGGFFGNGPMTMLSFLSAAVAAFRFEEERNQSQAGTSCKTLYHWNGSQGIVSVLCLITRTQFPDNARSELPGKSLDYATSTGLQF